MTPGQKLGSHEILAKLGEGGMGEVYLAHDRKLNRRVAIKVLPDAYASDTDRVARFHREAQAIAALNHSGIAGIYDLAEADGVKFLVLELIEGDTLADRVRRGPVPVEEALQIAKQILEALEAAHERGVCHRDLKPANIKLTPDGTVKVLDFGLAKFLQSSPSAPNLTHSPTLSLAGTYPGLILGTAGYMSPEQAKGFEADQRSDIFSFGCILYELLTGRQAFEGDTASEILASVLKSDVDWSLLPPHLNPRLVELLRRCLEKNPKKRWHAVGDVRVEIEGVISRAIVSEEPTKTVTPMRPLWKRAASAALFTLFGAAIAGYAAWILKPEPTSPVTRFTIPFPQGQVLTNLGRQAVTLSPDGTHLVYTANSRLFVRALAGLEVRAVAGTDVAGGAIAPSFSPDGQSIAFASQTERTIKRVAVGGGAAVTICTAERQPYGISWHDDAIVYGQTGLGIMSVSPNGGVPALIASAAADEVVDTPQLLPDGKGVMFAVRRTTESWEQGQIVVLPPGGERRVLIKGGMAGQYLPTGHLIYVLNGVMLVVPFDLETLTVSGGPVPLVEGVRRGTTQQTAGAPGTSFFAVSNTGTLAYVPGPVGSAAGVATDLAIFDGKGALEPLKLPPGPYQAPRVSRDGRRVAFENGDDKNSFISVYEIGGRNSARRLTFDGISRAPLWSVDGAWIVFSSNRDGEFGLYRTRADGSGTPERLTTPDKGTSHAAQSWSPDGQYLVYSVEKGASAEQSQLWVLSMNDRKVSQLGSMAAREAALSPDGKWIAYGTRTAAPTAANPNVVFVEPFPSTGAKYLLPQPGGHPVWSPKGDALLTNVAPTLSQLTPVTTSPAFAFGPPAEFSRQGRTEANPMIARRTLDMLPDGRVIGVMAQGGDQSAQVSDLVVVLNWFNEVRQRVPK